MLKWKVFYRHRSAVATGEYSLVAECNAALLLSVVDGIRREVCPDSDIVAFDEFHCVVRGWLVGQKNVNESTCSDVSVALSLMEQTYGLDRAIVQ